MYDRSDGGTWRHCDPISRRSWQLSIRPKRGSWRAAVTHASSELRRLFFVSLDDDAWSVDARQIAVAIDYLETHPRVACSSHSIFSSPDRPTPVVRSRAASHIYVHRMRSRRANLGAIAKLGLYRPARDAYGVEEEDLCYAIASHGWDVHLSTRRARLARQDGDQRETSAAQHRAGVCNDLAFAYPPLPAPSWCWHRFARLKCERFTFGLAAVFCGHVLTVSATILPQRFEQFCGADNPVRADTFRILAPLP